VKAVDTALYSRLATDVAGTATGTLGQLGATNVYRMVASQGSVEPYIVFNEQAGTDSYTFSAREARSLLYQVKAVDKGGSASGASSMAERIDALLTDAPLSLSGWTNIRLRRESDVEYVEVANGQQYHHIGGLYRVDIT
jgi:hypothetical protein